jgi:hypothetical protein
MMHARSVHHPALRSAAFVLLFLVGVLAVVLGEADDSPGLQGLGALMALASVALAWRRHRTSARGSRGTPDTHHPT